jgi:hypothetical protein
MAGREEIRNLGRRQEHDESVKKGGGMEDRFPTDFGREPAAAYSPRDTTRHEQSLGSGSGSHGEKARGKGAYDATGKIRKR